jgi:hypothetical protein
MSILKVDTINEKTSGNGVQIAGHVVQVVEGSATAFNITSSTSLTASNLSATITPKFSSSKILISLSINGAYHATETDYIVFHIYKGSSNHHSVSTAVGQNGETASQSVAHYYLDSPSTTSATTYTLYMRSGTGAANVGINNYGIGGNGSTRSTIILSEIAQ